MTINSDVNEVVYMINPFKKDKTITAKMKKKKEKQKERRQKAEARGQKPIK
jgi:hypothetical protein